MGECGQLGVKSLPRSARIIASLCSAHFNV